VRSESHADRKASARAIVHHDLLADLLGESGGDDAGDIIGSAARCLRYD
jgi:hypothetical protein